MRNFDELLEIVQKSDKKTVVIAAAQTQTAIDAAIMAKKKNIANSIMTGNKDFITNYLKTNYPEYINSFDIYDTQDDLRKGAEKAVSLIREKKGDLILKGKCDSGTLLKEVLNKEYGLRTGNLMNDVLAYETSDKLILMGDGGFLPFPDLNDKISIVKNCVKVAHSLGKKNPKVAMLTHSEKVNPKIISTIDAAVITRMNQDNQITECIVNGPIAFDIAVSKKAADMKGIKSEVAGDADILIVPNIEAGNIFGKALTYYCNFRVAHVVMGAKVPVLIASRADNAETKFLSMALGIMSA